MEVNPGGNNPIFELSLFIHVYYPHSEKEYFYGYHIPNTEPIDVHCTVNSL